MLSVFLDDVSPALYDLPAVYQAGRQEIDTGLQPQSTVFESNFVQGGSHAVDAHIAVDSEGGREQIGEPFPERRYRTARPRYA